MRGTISRRDKNVWINEYVKHLWTRFRDKKRTLEYDIWYIYIYIYILVGRYKKEGGQTGDDVNDVNTNINVILIKIHKY